MIESLYEYYDALRNNSSGPLVPDPGWKYNGISCIIELDNDGNVHSIKDIRKTVEHMDKNGKKKEKKLPVDKLVFEYKGRSGTNAKPYYFADKLEYIFIQFNNQKYVDDFYELHEEFLRNCADNVAKTFLKFIAKLKTGTAISQTMYDDKVKNAKLDKGSVAVFALADNPEIFIHEHESIVSLWRIKSTNDYASGEKCVCLITGKYEPIDELHGEIRGLNGESANIRLASYNNSAYCSYGKEQGYNAPVSKYANYKYTAALSYLVRNYNNLVKIGDKYIVNWSKKPASAEENLIAAVLGAHGDIVDDDTQRKVSSAMRLLSKGGRLSREKGFDLDERCHILCLEALKGRASTKFHYVGSLEELLEKSRQHFEDIHVYNAGDSDEHILHPSIWNIAKAGYTKKKGDKSRDAIDKDVNRLLESAVMGHQYPFGLYSCMLQAIGKEKDEYDQDINEKHETERINRLRAGYIKAYFNRKNRINNKNEELKAMLDKDNKDIGYRLGRLFAVMEKVQKDSAMTEIKSTIKDRYYNSAIATPKKTMPQLMMLFEKHKKKLRYADAIDFTICEIMSEIDEFPSTLTLEQQGKFIVGRYHQRQYDISEAIRISKIKKEAVAKIKVKQDQNSKEEKQHG